MVFGPWQWAMISLTGILIGAAACYGLMRLLFGWFPMPQCIDKRIRRWGVPASMLMRAFPFSIWDYASFGLGLLGVGLRSYLITSAIGALPFVILYSFWEAPAKEWIHIAQAILMVLSVISGILVARKMS